MHIYAFAALTDIAAIVYNNGTRRTNSLLEHRWYFTIWSFRLQNCSSQAFPKLRERINIYFVVVRSILRNSYQKPSWTWHKTRLRSNTIYEFAAQFTNASYMVANRYSFKPTPNNQKNETSNEKNMNTNQTKTSMISKYTIAVNEKKSGAVRSRCLSIHTRNSTMQITIALAEDPHPLWAAPCSVEMCCPKPFYNLLRRRLNYQIHFWKEFLFETKTEGDCRCFSGTHHVCLGYANAAGRRGHDTSRYPLCNTGRVQRPWLSENCCVFLNRWTKTVLETVWSWVRIMILRIPKLTD